MIYEQVIAKKDLECNKCGKLINKGSTCYIIADKQELICSECKPETISM